MAVRPHFPAVSCSALDSTLHAQQLCSCFASNESKSGHANIIKGIVEQNNIAAERGLGEDVFPVGAKRGLGDDEFSDSGLHGIHFERMQGQDDDDDEVGLGFHGTQGFDNP